MGRNGNRQARPPLPKVGGGLPAYKHRLSNDAVGRIRGLGYSTHLQRDYTKAFPSEFGISGTSTIDSVDNGDDR